MMEILQISFSRLTKDMYSWKIFIKNEGTEEARNIKPFASAWADLQANVVEIVEEK